MRACSPRVLRDRGVGPSGNPRRALAPEAPANQQSASGTEVSIPCRAVSPRQIFLCGSGLFELWRYGKNADPEMGYYPARVGRDRGGGPRGNPRRALAPEAPANQQSASGTWVTPRSGAVSTREYILYAPWLLEV